METEKSTSQEVIDEAITMLENIMEVTCQVCHTSPVSNHYDAQRRLCVTGHDIAERHTVRARQAQMSGNFKLTRLLDILLL
jgi:hypothetical protein